MTKIDLLTMLTDSLVRYKKDWRIQLNRDRHMNELTDNDICNIPEKVFDGILVDFINKIGVEQGVDYALYTKDLLTHKPKWK